METTLNNWRKFLNENQDPTAKVNRQKKRRKTDDPPSVKKRKQPWETFPGYDDRNGGLKQLANGIMEDGEKEEEIELLTEPSDDDLSDEELAEIAPALAAAARLASKAGKVATTASNAADKVGKVAGAVKTASDVAKKVLPDDDEEIEEACMGNPYRKSDGTWGSSKNHSVITHGYAGENSGDDCDAGKWKKGKGSTTHKCGREKSGKKHPYVCKTGKLREGLKKDKNGHSYVALEYILQLVEKEQTALLEMNDAEKRKAMAQKCLQMGYTTPQKAFQNLTTTLNSLQKSLKGDLNSEK